MCNSQPAACAPLADKEGTAIVVEGCGHNLCSTCTVIVY